jgi:hypothetical protein
MNSMNPACVQAVGNRAYGSTTWVIPCRTNTASTSWTSSSTGCGRARASVIMKAATSTASPARVVSGSTEISPYPLIASRFTPRSSGTQ